MDAFVLALLVLAIMLVVLGAKRVPQGMEYTVERFGRYTRTLRPGLNLIVPVVDQVGRKQNMMEQVLDVPSQEIITRDNAMVTVDGVVFFQVLDAAKASYEVNDLHRAILNLVMTNIRTVMGLMDLDELLSQRDHINARLLEVVDDATTPWGIKATRIEIKDMAPPRDLADAMARQMKAERDKRAAILEAKATDMVSQAIAKGDVNAINYFVAQKYTEALQNIASAENQKVIMVPLEASSLIGSLAGIGEIAKQTFGDKGPA